MDVVGGQLRAVAEDDRCKPVVRCISCTSAHNENYAGTRIMTLARSWIGPLDRGSDRSSDPIHHLFLE